MKLVILTPIYNDWISFIHLVQEIDALDFQPPVAIHILAINDGSTFLEPHLKESFPALKKIDHIEILHLIRNLGHQRAIAIGLVEVATRINPALTVIMDADGEDKPIDILALMRCHHDNPERVIVAKRTKRSEGILFAVFYRLYKFTFATLTGVSIDFGNFMLIPASKLEQFIYNADIWNHLAGMIVKSKIPFTRIPTMKGKRYAGNSKMNFTSLILHGLSAISVYADIVFVRLLIVSAIVAFLSLLGIVVVVAVKLTTDLAIPGWATTAVGLFSIIAFQAVAFSAGLIFTTLALRSQPFLIPAIEAGKLVKHCETVI